MEDMIVSALFLAVISLHGCVRHYPRNRIWQLCFYLSAGSAGLLRLISILGDR